MIVKISRKLVGKVEKPQFPKDGDWVLPKDVPEKVLVETEEPMKDRETGKPLPYGTPGVRIGAKLFLFGVPSPDGVVDVTKATMKIRTLASGTTVILTQE